MAIKRLWIYKYGNYCDNIGFGMTLIDIWCISCFFWVFIFGFVSIYLTYDKKEDMGFIILDEKD